MRVFKLILIVLFLGGFLLLLGKSAQAATLSLDPSKTSVASGKELVVKIKIKADPDELIDGADAVLDFDSFKLKPKQVKAGGAFKNLVTKEAKGRLQVTGLASTSGASFTQEVEIAQVSFQILESGKTNIKFSFSAKTTTDSNVAAHGTAKDLLTDVKGGTYDVTATPVQQGVSFFRRILPFLFFIFVILLVGGGLFYWYKRRGSGGGGREEVFVPHEAPLDRLPDEQPSNDVVGIPSVPTAPTSGSQIVGGEGS